MFWRNAQQSSADFDPISLSTHVWCVHGNIWTLGNKIAQQTNVALNLGYFLSLPQARCNEITDMQ
jgi:hypothetical protein